MSDQEPTTIRIGEILERAGLVTPGDLTEAVSVSKRLAMPIGRILIMSGCVTEQLLKAALDAQGMLRDRQISLETAIDTLLKVAADKITFQQALEKTDPQHLAGSTTSKLGEILLEFGLLDEQLLRQATVQSLESGMPLGTTLVTMNLLSPALLPAVLRASDQIRSGEVEREVAIEEFRSAYDMWVKAKESFKQGESDSELQTAQGQGRASNAQVTGSGGHPAQEEYFRRMAAMGHPGAYQPIPYPAMPPAYPPQYAPAPPYGASAFPGNPADWAVSGAPGYQPAPPWPGYPQPQAPNWQPAYPPHQAPAGYMQPPGAPAWAPPQPMPAPAPQPQQPPPPPPQNAGAAPASYPFPGVRPGAAPFTQPQADANPVWQGQPEQGAPQHPAHQSGVSHNGVDQSPSVVNYAGAQQAAPAQQTSGQYQQLPPPVQPAATSPSHAGLNNSPSTVEANIATPPVVAPPPAAPTAQNDTPSRPLSPVTGALHLTPGPVVKNEAAPSVDAKEEEKSTTRSEDGLPAFERVISRQMKAPTSDETTPRSVKKKRSGDKSSSRKALSNKTEDNEIIETGSEENLPVVTPPKNQRASHFKLPSSVANISGEYKQLGSNPFSLAPVKPNTGEHDALPKADESSETISKLSDHMMETQQTFFDWGPAEEIPKSIFPRDESVDPTAGTDLDQQPPTVLRWGPAPEIAPPVTPAPAPQASRAVAEPTPETTSGNNLTLSAAEPSQGVFNLSTFSAISNKPDVYPEMTQATSRSVDLSATAADATNVKMPLTRNFASNLVGVETQADLPNIDGLKDNAIEARATLSFKVESDYVSSEKPFDNASTVPDLPVVTVTAIGAVALTAQDRDNLLEKVADAAINGLHIETHTLNALEIGEPEKVESVESKDEHSVDAESIESKDEQSVVAESIESKDEQSVVAESIESKDEQSVVAESIESKDEQSVVAESIESKDEQSVVAESVESKDEQSVVAEASEPAQEPKPTFNFTDFTGVGESTFTDLKPIELLPIELPPIEVGALEDLPEDVVADISDLRNELLSEFSKVIDIQEGKKHSRLANGKADEEDEAVAEDRPKNRRGDKKGKKAAKNGKVHKEEIETDIEDAVASLHQQLDELPIEIVAEPVQEEPAIKSSKARSKSKKASKSESKKLAHHAPVDLVDLFNTAGLFSHNDLNVAFNEAIADPTRQAAVLNAIGILNPQLIECGIRCQTMLANGELKPQQVSFLLGVVRNGKSFDEALHDLGLSTAAAV